MGQGENMIWIALSYGVALVAGIGTFFSGRKAFRTTLAVAGSLGWILHLFLLLGRWRLGGFGNPPWTTMYEALILLAWCLVTVQGVFQIRYQSRWAAPWAFAFSLIFLGLAKLSPIREIDQLAPVNQSLWYFLAILATFFAYAYFLIAAGFALLQFVRESVEENTLLLSVSGVFVALFPWVARGDLFTLPAAKWSLVAAGSLFSLHLFLAAVCATREKWVQGMRKTLRVVFGSGLGAVVFFLSWSAWASAKVPGFHLSANRWAAGLLAFLLAAGVLLLLLVSRRKSLTEGVPSAPRFERWSYQAVVLGFWKLTLALLFGTIWSWYAWGSYFMSGVGQLWAYGLWLWYLIYLHMRRMEGGRGRQPSIVAALGLLLILFVLLEIGTPGLNQ